MKGKMYRNVIAGILIAAMLGTILPVNVYAWDETAEEEDLGSEEVEIAPEDPAEETVDDSDDALNAESKVQPQLIPGIDTKVTYWIPAAYQYNYSVTEADLKPEVSRIMIGGITDFHEKVGFYQDKDRIVDALALHDVTGIYPRSRSFYVDNSGADVRMLWKNSDDEDFGFKFIPAGSGNSKYYICTADGYYIKRKGGMTLANPPKIGYTTDQGSATAFTVSAIRNFGGAYYYIYEEGNGLAYATLGLYEIEELDGALGLKLNYSQAHDTNPLQLYRRAYSPAVKLKVPNYETHDDRVKYRDFDINETNPYNTDRNKILMPCYYYDYSETHFPKDYLDDIIVYSYTPEAKITSMNVFISDGEGYIRWTVEVPDAPEYRGAHTYQYPLEKQQHVFDESVWYTETEPGCTTYGYRYHPCMNNLELIVVNNRFTYKFDENPCYAETGGETLAPLGHKPGSDAVYYQPDCITPGRWFGPCASCNAKNVLIFDTSTEPKGHQYGRYLGKDSTCRTKGFEEYYKCSECGHMLNADGQQISQIIEKPLDPNRHTYGDPVISWSADYSLMFIKRVCRECGNESTETLSGMYYSNGSEEIGVQNWEAVASGTTELADGRWYAVTEDTTVSDRLTVNGSANLILCDDTTLTAQKGITVAPDASLTIWSQVRGTGVLNAVGSEGCAGIGGASGGGMGTVTIRGGHVNAEGGEGASGIGPGSGYDSDSAGTLNISFTKETDSVKADSYKNDEGVYADVRVVKATGDAAFVKVKETGMLAGGTLGEDAKAAAAGKTLQPFDRQFTITFDGNGGSSSMDELTVDPCTEYTIPACGFNPPEGTIFREWSVTIGSDEPVRKAPGDTITVLEDISLKAVYESHEHSYTSAVTTEPGCLTKGVRTYTCACGDSYTEDIDPLGHNHVGQITKVPSIEEAGVKTFTCTRCGDTYTEVMDPLDGSFLLYAEDSICIEKSVISGGSFTLIPKFAEGKVANDRVVWESENPAVASVSQSGKVTGRSLGKTVITARSEEDPELTASMEVTVTDPVEGIALDKKSYSFGYSEEGGESVELSATLLPHSASQEVKWSTDNAGVLILCDDEGYELSGEMNGKGKVYAVSENQSVKVKAVGTGKASVTAASADGSNKKAVCKFTVGKAVPAFTLEGKNKKTSVKAGKTLQISVNWGGKKKKPANTGVEWSVLKAPDLSDASDIAVISSKGVLTAITQGTVIVTATSRANPEKTASIEIKVEAPAQSKAAKVTGIEFKNKETLADKGLAAGKSYKLTKKLTLSGKGKAPADAVAFISTDNSVATVDQKGVIRGVSAGTVTIKAVTRDAEDIASAPGDAVTFTVYSGVKSLKLEQTKLILGTQDGTQYGTVKLASLLPADAQKKDIKWTAGSKNVKLAAIAADAEPSTGEFAEPGASVTVEDGKILAVMGIAPGTVKLTGTTTDGTKKKVTCTVTVRGQVTGLKLKTKSVKKGVNNITLADKEETADTIEYTGVMKANSTLTLTPVPEINGISAGAKKKADQKLYKAYSKATDTGVSYRSSDISVATVDAKGKISVKKGTSGKTVKIHAASADGKYRAEYEITVK